MYLITFLQTALALLATTSGTSLAPAPTSLPHHEILRSRARAILARNDIDNLDFCYGENAICGESVKLYNKCKAFDNLQDLTQWWECLCGNGYASVTEQ